MTKITLEKVAHSLKTAYPELDVRLPKEGTFEGLVVFPSNDSPMTLGVELFILAYHATVWLDGRVVKKILNISSPDLVATSLVEVLSNAESRFVR